MKTSDGRILDSAVYIQRKCEQYWNEREIGIEEVHAILEYIFREASTIRGVVEGKEK